MKLLSFILLSTIAHSHGDIDKVDFSKEIKIIQEKISPIRKRVFENLKQETKLTIKLIKGEQEKLVPTQDAKFSCNNNSARIDFSNEYFKVRNRTLFYIQGKIECGKTNIWTFKEDTDEGQVLSIYRQAFMAYSKLKELDLLDFWNRQISLKWPSNGDYYSRGIVNISRGDYWDVVGHEIGHAIYDQANIGVMEGGSHRIDECYTPGLALSEGWASFFSAWVNISLNDFDAKFEYLVKRRAPVRFENIPTDVCSSHRNEWRVTGFLWDLIDHNNDQENIRLSFKTLWSLMLNQNFRTTRELANHIDGYVDPVLLRALWKNNFKTEL